MNAALFLIALAGGGLGASTRFVVDGLVMRRAGVGYPWGTSVINVSGSLLLGFLTGLSDSSLLDASWLFILGGGFMGGYTTFSTAMVDAVHMLQKRTYDRALWNAIALLVVAVAAAAAGLLIGRSL